MAQRKPITKKTRFEVFKRDSFTCQYCGSKSPDSILEVDHINPVSKGGGNDIMNLVTSCFDCNRGKSDRKLSDLSVVEKQRMQIEELNLRRQQLEMMLDWRDGLKSINEVESQRAFDYINEKFDNYSLSKSGEFNIAKLVKKYGIIDVLNNFDEVVEKSYFNTDENERLKYCISKLGAYLNVQNQPEHKKQIAYIKGIARNKFHINEKIASMELIKYYENGYSLEDLMERLKRNHFRDWGEFIKEITWENEIA